MCLGKINYVTCHFNSIDWPADRSIESLECDPKHRVWQYFVN